MNIPNDTGENWRLNKAIDFIGQIPDEVTPLAVAYLKSKNAKKGGVVWFIFLYCCCYNVPTACFLYEHLDYRRVNWSEITKFWEENKAKLIFQSDRRYVKTLDKFPKMAHQFLSRTRREPWQTIKKNIDETDPQRTFKNICWFISNIYYFGQFSIMLFLEYLNKLLKVNFEGTEFNFKIGSYTTSGLFNIMYLDETADLFDSKRRYYTENNEVIEDLLYENLEFVVKGLREKYPKKKWNLANVTRGLAAYRKLYTAQRYKGYHVDRQQEELLKMRQNWPNYDNIWNLLDDARLNSIPSKYLGELNDYDGIQEKRCLLWTTEGVL